MIKLSDDPVWIQTTVLGLFGFVRDPHRRFTEQRQGGPKLRHGLQLLLAGLVLSSTLCLIIFEIGTDITNSLVAAREASREPFIIRILSNSANCFYPTRAVLVLTIFLT
ncbi:hypothetical protein BV898_03119 [Hypsibius exemplaris]|uniref:Uncharacterized protein n=1 Tax=Hypsibius exemplaris TaxID=2072580 RepID=A0A1W0X6F3_HYPEX|nr:hypothetical protein BV898_03119 [Hypsibius exemplaris]